MNIINKVIFLLHMYLQKKTTEVALECHQFHLKQYNPLFRHHKGCKMLRYRCYRSTNQCNVLSTLPAKDHHKVFPNGTDHRLASHLTRTVHL